MLDVAVRNVTTPLDGKALEIDLRDKNQRPLLPTLSPMDCGHLPTIQVGPSTSAHKAQVFVQVDGEPWYVVLRLDGHEVTVPFGLLLRPPNEDEDEDEEEEEKPRPPRYCPNTFATPADPQPSTVRPRAAAGVASANPIMVKTVFCRPWTITATFNAAPPPCHCPCCEYRQYVRSEMGYSVTIPPIGRLLFIDGSPAFDYIEIPIPGWLGGPIRIISRLSRGVWREDTAMIEGNPGRPMRYGHRADVGTPSFDNALQDYPSPCEYWANDEPQAGFALLDPILLNNPNGAFARQFFSTPLLTFDVDVEFRGEIIDSCRGGVANGPNFWRWTHSEPV